MEIKFFVFSTDVFQFLSFHENEAKHDKCNFKGSLTVYFGVKNL